jgi:hypothetical protein
MYGEFEKEFEEDIRKRTLTDVIAKAMMNLNLSFEKVLKILDIPQEDYNDYDELLRYFYPNLMQK